MFQNAATNRKHTHTNSTIIEAQSGNNIDMIKL